MPGHHRFPLPPTVRAAAVCKRAVSKDMGKRSRCRSKGKCRDQMNAIGQNSRLRVVAEARRQGVRHAAVRLTLPNKILSCT
jgi:hypothetical protein